MGVPMWEQGGKSIARVPTVCGYPPAAIEVCDSPEPVWPGLGFSLNVVAAGLSAWDGGQLPDISLDEESNEVLVIGNFSFESSTTIRTFPLPLLPAIVTSWPS